MLRGIIRGNIVSTRKQESLVGAKFMEVEIMDNGELTGRYIIAIDSVGAGIGETVLMPAAFASSVSTCISRRKSGLTRTCTSYQRVRRFPSTSTVTVSPSLTRKEAASLGDI